MSEAVRRSTCQRFVRGLTAVTAGLAVAGGAMALTLSGVTASATPVPASHVVAAPAAVQTAGGGNDWPYFACVAVYSEGICVGPPTT